MFQLSNKSSSNPLIFRPLSSPHDSITTDLVSSNRHKKRILAVDDDAFNILAIESLLKGFNFQIESAYNGQEAIDKILKKHRTRGKRGFL